MFLTQVAFLSAMSVINSALALPDWIIYGRRISRQELHPEPVFILGHPRTGTTHLHNLLSLDPAFAFCTTFNAGNIRIRPPTHFSVDFNLVLSPLLSTRLSFILHQHQCPEANPCSTPGGATTNGQHGESNCPLDSQNIMGLC